MHTHRADKADGSGNCKETEIESTQAAGLPAVAKLHPTAASEFVRGDALFICITWHPGSRREEAA